jgi:hypothetical protein
MFRRYPLFLFLLVALSSGPLAGAPYYVTILGDDGPGSLRDAITRANAAAGDIVIQVSGTVEVRSPLPAITRTTRLVTSGTSRLVLDGHMAGDASGLVIAADGVTLRGLTIVNFARHGIHLVDASSATLLQLDVGVDREEPETPRGNGGAGIRADGGQVTIEGGWIGHNGSGVEIRGGGGHLLQNLFVGGRTRQPYAPTGLQLFGNRGDGIVLVDVDSATVGRGMLSCHVLCFSNPNHIYANGGAGIRAQGRSLFLQVNTIGMEGEPASGNGAEGVVLDGDEVTFHGNRIAHNAGDGILLLRDALVQTNSIVRNGGKPIRIAGPSVASSPPQIHSAVTNGMTTMIDVSLTGRPLTPYEVELFVDLECRSGGDGQATWSFGTQRVTTDANGEARAQFLMRPLADTLALTATATDIDRKATSELSSCQPATRSAVIDADLELTFILPDEPVTPGTTIPIELRVTNHGPAPVFDAVIHLPGFGAGGTDGSQRGTDGISCWLRLLEQCWVSPLLPGATAFYQGYATVGRDVVGRVGAEAYVVARSGEPDPNQANNRSEAWTPVINGPPMLTDLEVELEPIRPSIPVGISEVAVVRIHNRGPRLMHPFHFTVTASGGEIIRVEGERIVCANNPRGACTAGGLAPGEMVEATITLEADGSQVHLVAALRDAGIDFDPSNNSASLTLSSSRRTRGARP